MDLAVASTPRFPCTRASGYTSTLEDLGSEHMGSSTADSMAEAILGSDGMDGEAAALPTCGWAILSCAIVFSSWAGVAEREAATMLALVGQAEGGPALPAATVKTLTVRTEERADPKVAAAPAVRAHKEVASTGIMVKQGNLATVGAEGAAASRRQALSEGLAGGAGGGYYGGGGGGGGGAGVEGESGPGGGGGGGSSYVEPSAKHVRMWQGWKDATGDGLVVFSWR